MHLDAKLTGPRSNAVWFARHPRLRARTLRSVARVSNGKDTILEIQFDSGERKKLLERFLEPI